MNLEATIGGTRYRVSMPGTDIAIPLDFQGAQPNTYGVAKAISTAYRSGGWVGDVREGGSCNFETVTLTPHCNGTHTECIGHITASRIHLNERLTQSLVPALLITARANPMQSSRDTYDPALNPEDMVIDLQCLQDAMPRVHPEFHQALVVRSMPNDASKRSRDYMQDTPPFFTPQALAWLAEIGVQHLLTDLPSVDRLFDEGKLSAHHSFWRIPAGQRDPAPDSRLDATITEMVFVPDHLPDGPYLLNLQVAPFCSDAAPSRPFLHPLQPL